MCGYNLKGPIRKKSECQTQKYILAIQMIPSVKASRTTYNSLMHGISRLLARDLKCKHVAIGWLGVAILPCMTWGRITYLFRIEIFGMANLLKRES